MKLIKKIWYDSFITWITWVYFRKITLYGKEHVPSSGPVLFIGLHKNGAVDGFVYNRLLSPVTFMLAAQLRRNPIIRLFFDGIEVTRDKDKSTHSNIGALKQCISFLENGGKLFVFPEGTSTLGPVHLPFKEGASILVSRFDFTKSPLTVVPCAVFYDDPTHLGGKAEVVTGSPLVFNCKTARKEIHSLFTEALEKTGIDFASAEEQQLVQKGAVLLSLYGDTPYYVFLRKIQSTPALIKQAAEIISQLDNKKLARYKEIVIFPRSLWGSIWTWCITFPFVCYAFVWNLLPVAAGWICSKKFPDDTNVISLWKIIPSFTLWLILTVLELIFLTKWTLLSVAISLLGFIVYGAWKKHSVSLYNFICSPAEMKKFNTLRNSFYEKVIH